MTFEFKLEKYLRIYEKRKKRKMKKKNPKIYLEPDPEPSIPDTVETDDNEDNESGFEVRSISISSTAFSLFLYL